MSDRREHDDQCEFGPREHNGRTVFFHICHCSKRRRERGGYTTPPGPLIQHAPSCPRCDGDVRHDGDGWQCDPCRASWGNPDEAAWFTDDYGDACQVASA